MKSLHIGTAQGKAFMLPADTVTSTLVAFGGKGMGKTNLGSVIVEELTAAGLRWAWLDPIGVSWGLRHSADGKGKGVECLILGGVHGDIPIDPAGGAAVADVVADERVNVLIDFSRKPNGEMWSATEKVRFCTAYIKQLFRRQGELIDGRRREPLFQVLDEAARYVPQIIPHGNPELASCVSGWEQAVEEGRNIGLGVGLWTLRSARLNKSVAELADVLFAFRTVGPNSLSSIMDWLGQHVDRAHVKDLAAQVRSLPRGSCLAVSPGWLKSESIVQTRLRHTFDSSATPKAGERARTAKGPGAKPDLANIRQRMAATIEKARAEDPRELQKLIASLREQLAKQKRIEVVTQPVIKEVVKKVPALTEAQLKRLEKLTEKVCFGITGFKAFEAALHEVIRPLPIVNGVPAKPVPATPSPTRSPASAAPSTAPDTDTKLRSGAVRILKELASRSPAGYTRAQVGGLTGFSHRGGTFKTYLSDLKRAGYLEERDDQVFATVEGITSLGADVPTAPTSHEDAMAMWSKALRAGAYRMLEEVVRAGHRGITREALSAAVGMEAAGGTFKTYISDMRRNGLVTERDGVLVANDILFPTGDV